MVCGPIFRVVYKNNNRGLYFSGEKISATLILQTCWPEFIQGITLVFWGRVSTYMLSPQKCQNVTILNERINILRREDGQFFQLPEGEHKYDFEFQLPNGLLSTLYEQYGHVHYEMIFTLDGNNGMYSICKIPFIILQDDKKFYEAQPNVEQRAEETDESCICSYCCLIQEPIKLRASIIPKLVHIGQNINIQLTLENGSNVKIEEIEFKLKKCLKFFNQADSSETWSRRYSVKKTIINNDADIEHSMSKLFEIPLTQPSTEFNSNPYINVRYEFAINGIIPTCCDANLAVLIPIVIGPGNFSSTRQQQSIGFKVEQFNIMNPPILNTPNVPVALSNPSNAMQYSQIGNENTPTIEGRSASPIIFTPKEHYPNEPMPFYQPSPLQQTPILTPIQYPPCVPYPLEMNAEQYNFTDNTNSMKTISTTPSPFVNIHTISYPTATDRDLTPSAPPDTPQTEIIDIGFSKYTKGFSNENASSVSKYLNNTEKNSFLNSLKERSVLQRLNSQQSTDNNTFTTNTNQSKPPNERKKFHNK